MTPARRRAIGTALMASAFISAVVIANHASTRWPALHAGRLLVPTGTRFVGATFTLHMRGVAAAIVTSTALSWLLVSPRIVIGSVVAA